MDRQSSSSSWAARLETARSRPTHRRNVVDDGFFSPMAQDAKFVGPWDIPTISTPEAVRIPEGAVPFSMLDKRRPDDCTVFFENDPLFADTLLAADEFLDELLAYELCATPDCSIYYDMPFSIQPANIYLSRLWGSYVQRKGMRSLIPTCRWGDERTYEPYIFEEPLAFIGLPKKSIYWVGSYGVSKRALDTHHLARGLSAMMEICSPELSWFTGPCPKRYSAHT